jgi:steroid delta-isomerase-like uncharacterized protein
MSATAIKMDNPAGRLSKTMAQRLIDALNTRSEQQILQLYDANYIGEDLTGNKTRRGTDAIRQWLQNIFLAFPNIHYELEDSFETDERMVVHWIATGNHQGTFLKIPATGKPVSIHGMSITRIKDGKITEGKLIWDLAGVLRQLGLLPQMP